MIEHVRDPQALLRLGEDSGITDEARQPVLHVDGSIAILAQFGLLPQGATARQHCLRQAPHLGNLPTVATSEGRHRCAC